MTADEWATAGDPQSLLSELFRHRPLAPARKYRLFGVACCRRTERLLSESSSGKDSLTIAERWADGQMTDVEVRHYEQRMRSETHSRLGTPSSSAADFPDVIGLALQAAADCLTTDLSGINRHPFGHRDQQPPLTIHALPLMAELHQFGLRLPEAIFNLKQATIRKIQCEFLRDIFGNPFRPVAFQPDWRTSTVTGLSESIYQSRSFDLMPVLGDSLEEAGCDQPDILAHCRVGNVHVRGCWVVDHCLGR